MSTCKGCGEDIEFVRHERTGNTMCLEEVPGGGFRITEDDVGQRWAVWAGRGKGTHDSHHATCPQADRFRTQE